jgi:hypothetical protein
MAKNSYFSHDSPTGVTPWHWFKEAGYPFVHAGENLAVYFTDSGEVVNAWMNSPTHRANIVGSQYREIGVGTARGTYDGFETVFVVQMFGTQALPPKPAIVASQNTVVPQATIRQAATSAVAVVEVPTSALPLVAGEATDTIEMADEVTQAVSSATTSKTISAAEAVASRRGFDFEAEVATSSTTTATTTATTAAAFAEEAKVVMGAAEAISLYSGMAASSTNLEPAPFLTIDLENVSVPKAMALATEPSKVLQLIYLILGGLTALVLLLSVVLEWRHHRPVQTAYGLLLLLVMAGLFYVHTTIIAGAVIL